ncbi:FAD-dependent monooxygenase [Tsuneonella flava]|uniref:FAD-dependent monooxygenase n=1 Tax=Tsuneonella flava TaxID=2055955 RepID=UPI0018E4C6E3|nr:FAD-dependent monooxygenase [Tsuneonella flava]
MSHETLDNVIIVGAGPAGLALARSLADAPVRVTVLEYQPEATIADPRPDGREIALTLRSQGILSDLGVWPLIPQEEIHPLRGARVRDGGSSFAMAIDPTGQDGGQLGNLVPNHAIRRALYQSVSGQERLDLRTEQRVIGAAVTEGGAEVRLASGEILRGAMVVAADSRFSAVRGMLGIGARIHKTQRTMICMRVRHSGDPLGGKALEWFDRGRTVALLPLGPGLTSFVLTLPDAKAADFLAWPEACRESYARAILAGELGDIEAVEQPFAYPLTMTFSERFVRPRAALVGDAAVGMHPVTAHGFNFGLAGAWELGRVLRGGMPRYARLVRYAIERQMATLPLYEATRHLVGLYTDDTPFARPVRKAVLRLGASKPVSGALALLLSGNRRLGIPARSAGLPSLPPGPLSRSSG